MLELCDGKLSSMVLRGERGCKAPDLLGPHGIENEHRLKMTAVHGGQIKERFNGKKETSKEPKII